MRKGAPFFVSSTYVLSTRVNLNVPADRLASQPPESDLAPPVALRDASQVLREIMSVYESTLVDGDTEREADFGRILDAAVDPPLEMCRRMADLRGGQGGEWEKAIFLANCVSYLEVSIFADSHRFQRTLTDP